jgi:Mg/Co/Ni transporter MgtE
MLAVAVVLAGFARVVAFEAASVDAFAISASLFLIVTSSVVLGTALPLGLNKLRIDAAHASTSIQVIMDVLGVLITCTVAPLVFENADRIFAASLA